MDSRDLLVLAFLFVVAFFVWSLPFQGNPLPFGEADAAWHFAVGDYQHNIGKTVTQLPMFVEYWYYNFTGTVGGLQYPPSMHVDYALMQFAGRFVPVFIFKAITSFAGALVVYFFVSRLYGKLAAFIASFALIFSFREISLYLWGQQPTLAPYVFLPLILYSFYRYLDGYYSGSHRQAYLYITVLLLSAQYLFHLQTLMTSLFALGFFTLFMSLKNKRLPVGGDNVKHIVFCAVLFLVVALPFINIYLGASQAESVGFKVGDLSRLFSWTLSPNLVQGSFPPAFVSFSAEYSLWLLPFILAGALFLVLRRKSEDLLVLAWLAAVYLTLHADVFMGADQLGRVARALVVEPPLFFTLAALSPLLVASFVGKYKRIVVYSFSFLLFAFVVFNVVVPSYGYLGSAYAGISRMTPAQYDFAVWSEANLPGNAVVFEWGSLTYPKRRWMLAVSNRYVTGKSEAVRDVFDNYNSSYYLLLDYSDLAVLAGSNLRDQYLPQLQEMQAFEKDKFSNRSPVFNQGNMRLYEVERNEVPA